MIFQEASRRILRAFRTPQSFALVGNGAVDCRHAVDIDRHDFVVRFNGCQHYGSTGLKTDVLVLVNTGPQGYRLATTPEAINPRALASAKQIYFPKSPGLVRELAVLHPEDVENWTDHSGALMKRIGARPHRFLDDGNFWDAQYLLEQSGATKRHEPSTGMLMLSAIHRQRKLRRYTVTLYGFSHEGWIGHAWDAERVVVDSWSRWVTRAEHAKIAA
jgi:hypothetical protein